MESGWADTHCTHLWLTYPQALENGDLSRNGGWEKHRKALAGFLQSVIGTSMCTSLSYTLGQDFDAGLVGGVEIGGERPSIHRVVLGWIVNLQKVCSSPELWYCE